MILRRTYTLQGASPRDLDQVDLPFVVKGEDATYILSVPEGPEHWRAVVERTVPHTELELRDAVYRGDEIIQSPSIFVTSSSALGDYVTKCTNALAFLLNRPLRLASRDAVLVAESAADERLLKGFGTETVYSEASVVMGQIRCSYVPTADAVDWLTQRPVGIELFADALGLTSPEAKYRALWLIVEAAFGRWKKDLPAIAADFPPLKQIGATQDELTALRKLRGDISHAWRINDPQELKRVKTEAHQRLARVQSIVDCIILTQSSWGTPDYAHEPDPPMAGYNQADGGIVVFQQRRDN